MRSRYRRTLLGLVWVIANPILNFVVQALVFKAILKINISNYPLFLLSGLMPWYFISSTLTSHTSCLVQFRELLLGMKISSETIVMASVVDSFINFILATLVLIIGLVAFNYVEFSFINILLFLINGILLFPFVYFLTALLSFAHVFYRDVQFVTIFIIGLAFYATPIFYSPNFIAPEFQWILKLNPLYPFIKNFQLAIYQTEYAEWFKNIFICVLETIGLIFIYKIFRKRKIKDFYINV